MSADLNTVGTVAVDKERLNSSVRNGAIRERRHRKKWIDSVKEDTNTYNLDMRTAIDMARDRSRLRNLV